MGRRVIWATVFALIAAILQSTLFSHLEIHHTVPDLALGILVFSAYTNGSMTGQLTGFFSGFLIDFLSAAPLGFNAFIRTVIGFLTGLMKGTFFLDIFFLPMGLCAGATMVKAFLFFLLHLLFGRVIPVYPLQGPTLWVELLLNSLSAPILFGFLKFFSLLLVDQGGR
jgi:rod shape-determining protein MreD